MINLAKDSLPTTRELAALVEKSVEDKIKMYPRNSIWASQLDHPCLRYNEYGLTRWKDQAPVNRWLQEIFEEGKDQEEIVKKALIEAGYLLRQSQRPLVETVKNNGSESRYKISGRLDVEITHPYLLRNIWYPAEIKSVDSFMFDSINEEKGAEQFLESKRWYVRQYPGQIIFYLYASGKELGLMIFKNKLARRMKFVWAKLDYDIAERMLQKAEEINRVVAKVEKNPDKAEDLLSPRLEGNEQVCSKCSFAHICLPSMQFGGTEIELDPEIETKLREWIRLKEEKEKFEELDEEVKEPFKKRGPGLYLVGGSFNVKVSTFSRAVYNLPAELKEQYREQATSTRVDIKQLDGRAK